MRAVLTAIPDAPASEAAEKSPPAGRVQPLRVWVRQNARAIALMVIITGAWGFATGVIVARVLRIRLTEIDGRPATRVEQWRFFGEPAVIDALLLFLVLLALTAPFRLRLRVRPLIILVALLGTPAAVLTAILLEPVLSGGTWRGPVLPLEVATAVGLAAAWVLWVVMLALGERYRLLVRVRVVRRDAPPRSLCPECRYDLAATTTGICPECGWVVPGALRPSAPG